MECGDQFCARVMEFVSSQQLCARLGAIEDSLLQAKVAKAVSQLRRTLALYRYVHDA